MPTFISVAYRVFKGANGDQEPGELQFLLHKPGADWEPASEMVGYKGQVQLIIDFDPSRADAQSDPERIAGIKRMMSFVADNFAARIDTKMTCLP